MVAFALLEPACLGCFQGVVGGAICFRGASSPVHLHVVFFVQAMGGNGKLEAELRTVIASMYT
jgi:hypothetical protein